VAKFWEKAENELLVPEGRRVHGWAPPENLENLGLLEHSHFLHSEARIRAFEQNRKHKSPLKLLRIEARFFYFS